TAPLQGVGETAATGRQLRSSRHPGSAVPRPDRGPRSSGPHVPLRPGSRLPPRPGRAGAGGQSRGAACYSWLRKCPPRRLLSLWLFGRLGRLVEERHRLQLHLLDRLKVVEHLLSLLAADLGMEVQAESVWSLRVDQLRLKGEERLDGVELAQHRRAEQ